MNLREAMEKEPSYRVIVEVCGRCLVLDGKQLADTMEDYPRWNPPTYIDHSCNELLIEQDVWEKESKNPHVWTKDSL